MGASREQFRARVRRRPCGRIRRLTRPAGRDLPARQPRRDPFHAPIRDVDHQIVIAGIMKMANAGLSFCPRGVSTLHGINEEQARLHCRLLAKARQLGAFVQYDEIWYRRAELRQASLL